MKNCPVNTGSVEQNVSRPVALLFLACLTAPAISLVLNVREFN